MLLPFPNDDMKQQYNVGFFMVTLGDCALNLRIVFFASPEVAQESKISTKKAPEVPKSFTSCQESRSLFSEFLAVLPQDFSLQSFHCL